MQPHDRIAGTTRPEDERRWLRVDLGRTDTACGLGEQSGRDHSGRGWFLYIRLYGPGADWFDEEIFTLPEIEKVS